MRIYLIVSLIIVIPTLHYLCVTLSIRTKPVHSAAKDFKNQLDGFYSYVLRKGIPIKHISKSIYSISHLNWTCTIDTSIAAHFVKKNISWRDLFETRIEVLRKKTIFSDNITLHHKMGLLPDDGTPITIVARPGNISIPDENVIIRLNNHGPLDARTTMTMSWPSLVKAVTRHAHKRPNNEIIHSFLLRNGTRIDIGNWNTSRPLVITKKLWKFKFLKFYRGPLFFMKKEYSFGNFSNCKPHDGIGLGALNRIAHLKGDISTLGFSAVIIRIGWKFDLVPTIHYQQVADPSTRLIPLDWYLDVCSNEPTFQNVSSLKKNIKRHLSWKTNSHEINTVNRVYLRNISSANKGNFSETFWNYIDNIEIICKNRRHIGPIADTGYDVCEDYGFKPNNPCLVYSFGSLFGFEEDVIQTYRCEIHTFHPSLESTRYKIPAGIKFHHIGLSDRDIKTSSGWQKKTLASIKSELNQSRKMVDILKIDLETSEWRSFQNIYNTRDYKYVKQILVKFYLRRTDKTAEDRVLKVFLLLQEMGFLAFTRGRFVGHKLCRREDKSTKHMASPCLLLSFINIDRSPQPNVMFHYDPNGTPYNPAYQGEYQLKILFSHFK